MKNLTLVIPARKEKESLPQVIDEIKNLDCKKKVILNPDDIDTINAIKNLNVDIIYQNHRGYGDALITGINNVDTDYFCIFNADGSFNPNELEKMMSKINSDNLDFIFASRYEKNSKSDDDTLLTYIGNKIFTLIGKIFFKLNITDILYTFVLGKTDKAKNLNLTSFDFGFCVELPIKANKQNMKLGTINSHERKRIAGKKKVNAFKDGLLILIKMFKLYFHK